MVLRDLSDRPFCTIPKPSKIIPIALIRPKINSLKLLITVSGSFDHAMIKATFTV